MTPAELHRVAWAAASECPAITVETPFGPEWEVAKVVGKLFLLAPVAADDHITLKADPYDAEQLRRTYPDIRPGYHMNKRHWISLYPGDSLTPELVRDLVIDSYCCVVATLPVKSRPVDPERFGRSAR